MTQLALDLLHRHGEAQAVVETLLDHGRFAEASRLCLAAHKAASAVFEDRPALAASFTPGGPAAPESGFAAALAARRLRGAQQVPPERFFRAAVAAAAAGDGDTRGALLALQSFFKEVDPSVIKGDPSPLSQAVGPLDVLLPPGDFDDVLGRLGFPPLRAGAVS